MIRPLPSCAISTLAREREIPAMPEPGESLRLDKWLWFARFFKSRTSASHYCAGGKIRINGRIIEKPHHAIKPGDVLTFPLSDQVRVIKVKALAARRGSAALARLLYEDLASRPERPAAAMPSVAARDHGAGRPTKAERRAIVRITGRS